jgi:precorrin-6x reductase
MHNFLSFSIHVHNKKGKSQNVSAWRMAGNRSQKTVWHCVLSEEHFQMFVDRYFPFSMQKSASHTSFMATHRFIQTLYAEFRRLSLSYRLHQYTLETSHPFAAFVSYKMYTKQHLNTEEMKKANIKYWIFGRTALLQKNHDGTKSRQCYKTKRGIK